MDARERFYEVRDALGLTDYRIYTDVQGVTKGMLDRLRQGITTDVSNKWLIPFLEAYPQVNANYILTGSGPMFLEAGIVDKCKQLEIRLKDQDSAIKHSQIYIGELKKQNESVSKALEKIRMENEKLRDAAKKSVESAFFRDEAAFYKDQAVKLMAKVRELESNMIETKPDSEDMITGCR